MQEGSGQVTNDWTAYRTHSSRQKKILPLRDQHNLVLRVLRRFMYSFEKVAHVAVLPGASSGADFNFN